MYYCEVALRCYKCCYEFARLFVVYYVVARVIWEVFSVLLGCPGKVFSALLCVNMQLLSCSRL